METGCSLLYNFWRFYCSYSLVSDILESVSGFSPVKAGVFTAVFSLLASGFRVVGGAFSDRVGGEKASMMSMFLGTVSIGHPCFCKQDRNWNFCGNTAWHAEWG